MFCWFRAIFWGVRKKNNHQKGLKTLPVIMSSHPFVDLLGPFCFLQVFPPENPRTWMEELGVIGSPPWKWKRHEGSSAMWRPGSFPTLPDTERGRSNDHHGQINHLHPLGFNPRTRVGPLPNGHENGLLMGVILTTYNQVMG